MILYEDSVKQISALFYKKARRSSERASAKWAEQAVFVYSKSFFISFIATPVALYIIFFYVLVYC